MIRLREGYELIRLRASSAPELKAKDAEIAELKKELE